MIHTRLGLSGLRAGLAYSVIMWTYLIRDRRALAVIYLLALSIHFSIVIFVIIRILASLLYKKITKKNLILLLVGAISFFYVLSGIRSTLLDAIFSVPSINITLGFLISTFLLVYTVFDQRYISNTLGGDKFIDITLFLLLAVILSIFNDGIFIDRIWI